jgi:UDP-glucose 4-epimerase
VEQARAPERFAGAPFNVGGGAPRSLSLRELTTLCRAATGRRNETREVAEERYGDVPWLVTDHRRITDHCGWQPRIGVELTVEDVCRGLLSDPALLTAW